MEILEFILKHLETIIGIIVGFFSGIVVEKIVNKIKVKNSIGVVNIGRDYNVNQDKK